MQKQLGVLFKQTAPFLTHDFARLLFDRRQRAQSALSTFKTRTNRDYPRDIALFSLTFESMRRGYDPSFTMGSQVLRLPESTELIFNFQFGRKLLADKECPQVCTFRGVTEYCFAAQSTG